MSINSNQVKLIGVLLQGNYPITDLAKKMAVSRRHVHNYITNINYYIDQAICVTKGIASLQLTPEQWAQKITEIPLNHYRPISNERQDYLLDSYLFLEQYRYLEIEKKLGISRPTLKKDLSELERRLQLSGLVLRYLDNGFAIEGTEKKLRHLMMERINEQVIAIQPQITYRIATTPLQHHTQRVMSQLLARLPVKEINVIIRNISQAIGGKFPVHFTKLMFLYLSISLHRINQGHLILQKNNADYLRQTDKFKLVQHQLSLLINQQLEFEHLHLTEYFFSGCATDNFHENQVRVEMCAMLFLREIRPRLSLSHSQTTQLHTQLCQYLPSAIYRIKNHVRLQSVLNHDIEQCHEYKVTVDALSNCQHWLPEPLRNEELHQIHQFVEQSRQVSTLERLSLNELLCTVQDHATDVAYEPLKRALLSQYPALFSDDTQPDYLQPNWFTHADIHWIHSSATRAQISEFAAIQLANKLNLHYQDVQPPLTKVLTAFIDYLQIGSNVYLYSAQANSATEQSTLQLVIQEDESGEQTSANYYFFLLRNESTTPLNLLYALHQFEQHKQPQEQQLAGDAYLDWLVTLIEQEVK
ncbi:helix-turn-helix domain-containing protein [Vibrio panuliri]|uniref:Mga helix-turn-helix domain-containing protein n=1 Tax=Vibrio panuliri TaxID=1381081 RepID=A0ABX3FJU1_9VIBR|nr:helix-turn-helix domain-containing protein [Vibrio panuliri]KAB1453852.1 hypothetical protein F7O85_13165 [Vibrio panuliri]OLQ92022.1 hypothetical protein BIY20_09310 [Vibrio panuliri]